MNTLNHLIETHRAAAARFLRAARAADEFEAAEDGRAVTLEAIKEFEAALAVERDAEKALLDYRPADMAEARQKATYLLSTDISDDIGERGRAILASLAA